MYPPAFVYELAWWLNEIAQPVAVLGALAFWIISKLREKRK